MKPCTSRTGELYLCPMAVVQRLFGSWAAEQGLPLQQNPPANLLLDLSKNTDAPTS